MIHVGDCRDVLRTFDDNSIDAIVTDPPYHLTHLKAEDPRRASPDKRQRDRGFMGMDWDGGDVAFRPETWAEALRVAKPGAHLVAFGGPRRFHRLMCAIEDAGWELRDTLMWVFGSGFPKSQNPCRCQPHVDSGLTSPHGWRLCAQCGNPFELGTGLKPAWEPIVLARKSLSERNVLRNVERWGTGALNIEACRIGDADDEMPGRWPANLVHDGSGEVIACFPSARGAQSNVTGKEPSAATRNTYDRFASRTPMAARREGEGSANRRYSSSGGTDFAALPGARRAEASASRFFYCAKVDRSERNAGLEGWPKGSLRWSDGEQSPGTFQSGGTNRAAENDHPTVKPVELMRWLCRLTTPRGGRVLDMFCGSGSTGCAAIAEGFDFVGVEQKARYARIAEARIQAVQPGLPMEAYA